MNKAYNANIRALFDLFDQLSILLKGSKNKIPWIALCRMESHDKRRKLESITHISLPECDATLTVFIIKISLRNEKSSEEYARIKFEIENEDKYQKISLDEIADKINEYQNKIRKKNNVKEGVVLLFDEII